MSDTIPKPKQYEGATGGWGSLEGIGKIEASARAAPGALATLKDQNKPGGYMCSSCAWIKPKDPHAFEFCENGAKATLWDLTTARCTPEFFDRTYRRRVARNGRLRSGEARPSDRAA